MCWMNCVDRLTGVNFDVREGLKDFLIRGPLLGEMLKGFKFSQWFPRFLVAFSDAGHGLFRREVKEKDDRSWAQNGQTPE